MSTVEKNKFSPVINSGQPGGGGGPGGGGDIDVDSLEMLELESLMYDHQSLISTLRPILEWIAHHFRHQPTKIKGILGEGIIYH